MEGDGICVKECIVVYVEVVHSEVCSKTHSSDK